MVRASGLLLGAAAALGLANTAGAYDTFPQRLARLTPADASARIRVNEAAEPGQLVVSTENVWNRDHRVEGAHFSDVHIRAVVDRRDGSTRWQVWHELHLFGEKREITGLTYSLEAGGRQGDLVFSKMTDENCPDVDAPPTGCHVRVSSAFEVPDHVVQNIAQSYEPGSRSYWKLHFTDEAGRSIIAGISPAEVAGLRHSVQKILCQDILTC